MEHMLGETELLRLADLNMVQEWCEGANWVPGSEIVWRGDTVLIDSALKFPACSAAFNLAETMTEAPDEYIARAALFFTGRAQYFSLIFRAHADRAMIEYCRNKKFYQISEEPGMVLDAPLKPGPIPADAKLKWVTDGKGVDDYSTVVAEAFQDLAFPKECSRGYFACAERVLSPYTLMAVVYLNDVPASTALAILSHGIAGIYWVGTVKSARGRGLAEYSVREVSNAAFAAGARKVVLQASQYGEPIYRRMGFREFTRYPWFLGTVK